MIELEIYIRKYKLMNEEAIKKLSLNNSLLDGKFVNNRFYIGEYLWKIDLRRVPKILSSIHIRASIIQSINDRFHLDYKMINIEESHFLEYLKMLIEVKLIRLVKYSDPNKVESYIIGNTIPDEIIGKRKKLLRFVDSKFDLALNKVVEVTAFMAIDKLKN